MALYLDASLRRTAASEVAVKRTYIRSREFDTTLLAAPILAGLAAALMVTADARLYPILLLADLWLLGYHHVVATYTRLAFDTQSLRRNRFLAVDLLGIVKLNFSDANWASAVTPITGLIFAGFIFWLFCFGMSRYSGFMERHLDTGPKR